MPRAHRRRRRSSVVGPVVGLLVLALCGLLVFGFATVQVGIVAVVIGVAAAVVPVGIVIPTFLWVDRWEPEPAKYLLLTFAWGACVATLTALLINDTATMVGDMLLGSGQGAKLSAVVSAPLIEEAVKAVPVVLMLWWYAREFDGVVDGIVYSGFSAAGFAFTENIYYFGRAFAEQGFGEGLQGGVLVVFVMRGVLSPFAHPLFTVLTGIGIGLIARPVRRLWKWLVPLLGYFCAVILHAAWNASTALGSGQTFLVVYFLIMVPIFFGMLYLVVWQRRREQQVIEAALPEMVSHGWIARSEVPLLTDLARRRQWRRAARHQSGRAAARAVADYQMAVTEYAFARRWPAPDTRSRRRARRYREELVQDVQETRAEAVRLAV